MVGDRIKDDDLGKHAGWGSADDQDAPPADLPSPPDRTSLRRYVAYVTYNGPGSGLMLLYLPAMVGLWALEVWLGMPVIVIVISLIGLAISMTVIAGLLNRPRA